MTSSKTECELCKGKGMIYDDDDNVETCGQCGGVGFIFSEKSKSDMSKGVKFDSGKLRYDLIPALALEKLAEVYSYGAKKYSDRNWEKGLAWSRGFAALMRHSWAFWKGETYDPESGLHHMAHAAFTCLSLIEFTFTHPEFDDRPKNPIVLDENANYKLCVFCNKEFKVDKEHVEKLICPNCGAIQPSQSKVPFDPAILKRYA